MDPHTPETQERPDEEWQLVREEIAVIRESGIDESLLQIIEKLIKEGHDYRLILEIVCSDRAEFVKHLQPDMFPQFGTTRVVDTKLPEHLVEYQQKSPFPMPMVRLMLCFNQREIGDDATTRYNPQTLKPLNPKKGYEYDALTVEVNQSNTFIGSKTVRIEEGKPTVPIASEGKEVISFLNGDVTRKDPEVFYKIGAIIGDGYELFPAIK